MARYIGPVCVLCRREGEKLYLKGDRCFSPKCAIERRNYPPGPHGQSGAFRRKQSDYAMQLREKQNRAAFMVYWSGSSSAILRKRARRPALQARPYYSTWKHASTTSFIEWVLRRAASKRVSWCCTGTL